MDYTGITEAPGRAQPYTAWYKGLVVKFTATRAEAEIALRKVQNMAAKQGVKHG